MRTAVVIASAGRATLLADVLSNVDALEGNFEKLLSVPDTNSLPPTGVPSGWEVITGARGLAAQRNAALDRLLDYDVVVFFDDDSVIRHDFVARALRFFQDHPDMVGLTGEVLLDGALAGEVPASVAAGLIDDSAASPRTGSWRPSTVLYGCNFAIRLSAAPTIRFDARLPLYSWLEDNDMARRLMRVGRLARVDDCVIVHRGATSGGRQAHERFGYSQVMNPVHLWRKGSYPAWLAAYQLGRSTASNVVKSVSGAETAGRRRRLRGNLLAAADVVRGRVTPERILEL